MPVIYDGLAWCDIALFTTSVRWGSHTAVMQRVIERMNTLTGRTTTWGEAEPLAGKRVGVIVGGFNWRSRQVGIRLAEILQELGVGFEVPEEGILTWQLESDPYVEQEEAIRPEAIDWLRSPAGIGKVRAFVHSYLRGPVDL